jgi:hypothetical protein
MSQRPELADVVRVETQHIVGLLMHACLHLNERTLERSRKPSTATRRAHALLDELRSRS